MKAAIYARKSTDDSDRNEENKSVTRQVERARAYSEAKGWTIASEHIFVDDGIKAAPSTKTVPASRGCSHALRSLTYSS